MAQLPGNARVCQYTATADQTVFIYNYKIYNDDEITVQNGDTTLTLTTHYTVQDAGETSGGTITLVTGATLADIITVTGNSMIERDTTFTNGGDYLASAINGEYDKLDNITKEIVTGNTTYMKLAKYSPSISVVVPAPVASKAIKWNAAGTALELSTYDPDEAQTTAEAAEAGAVAAEAGAVVAQTAAEAAQTAAELAETNAETAETNAETAETNAAASAASINAGTFNLDMIPATDGSIDLGSSTKRWAESHVDTAAVETALTVTGTTELTGNVTVNTDKVTVAAATGNTVIAGTLDVTGNLTAANFGASDIALFKAQFASGTDGGTAASGAWRTRPINTTDINNITSCSLASNQITLPAGVYNFMVTTEIYDVAGCSMRLYNTTDSAIISLWGAGVSDAAGGATNSTSFGQFTLADTKVLEVQMDLALTQVTNGMGKATNNGTETYLVMQIEQLP